MVPMAKKTAKKKIVRKKTVRRTKKTQVGKKTAKKTAKTRTKKTRAKPFPVDTGRDFDRRLADKKSVLYDVFHRTNAIVMIARPDGKLTFVNPAFRKLTGRTAKEVVGKSYKNLHPKASWPRVEKNFRKHITDSFSDLTLPFLTKKKGVIKRVALNSATVKDASGRVVRAIAIGRDLTELRMTERALRESEARFRQVAENARNWLWEVDVTGLYTYASWAVKKILGHRPEELVGKKHFYDLFVPKERAKLKNAAFATFAKKQPFRGFKNPTVHKNGKTVWVSTSGVPVLDDDGKLLGYRGADTDITEVRRIHRELETSRDFQSAIVKNAPIGVFVVNETGRIIFTNPAHVKMSGKKSTKNKILLLNLFKAKSALESGFDKQLRQGLAGKKFDLKNLCYSTQLGKRETYLNIKGVPFKDPETGKPRVLCIVEDVTKQKEAEAALLESESRFKQFFENEPEYCYMISPEGILLDINSAARNVLGYTKKELVGKPLKKIYAPESLPKVKRLFRKWKREGSFRNEEITIITKQGERRIVSLSVDSVKDAKGKLLHSVSIQRDITEHKQADLELQKSHERLQDFFDNANDLIQSIASDGRILYVNRKWRETLGYKKRDIKKLSLFDILHPESRAHCRKVFKQVLSGKPSGTIEAKFLTKDGRTILVEGNANCRFENGKPVATRGIFRDITDKKRTQQEIKNARDAYLKITNLTGEIIVTVDVDGKIVFTNEVACKFWGKPCEDFLGKKAEDLIYPEDLESSRQAFKELMKNRTPVMNFVTNRQKTSKGWRIVEWNGAPMIDDAGKCAGFQKTGRDITDKKLLYDALEDSEKKYSTLVEQATDGIVVLQDGLTKFVNFAFAKFLGYTKEEMVGTPFPKYIAPEEREVVVQKYKDRMAGKKFQPIYETKLIRKDASIVPVEFNAGRGTYEGRPADYVLIRDFTERKKTEEKILRGTEELAQANTRLMDVQVELEKKIGELESFNKLAVGRELKMIELKERIKGLEKRLEARMKA